MRTDTLWGNVIFVCLYTRRLSLFRQVYVLFLWLYYCSNQSRGRAASTTRNVISFLFKIMTQWSCTTLIKFSDLSAPIIQPFFKGSACVLTCICMFYHPCCSCNITPAWTRGSIWMIILLMVMSSLLLLSSKRTAKIIPFTSYLPIFVSGFFTIGLLTLSRRRIRIGTLTSIRICFIAATSHGDECTSVLPKTCG